MMKNNNSCSNRRPGLKLLAAQARESDFECRSPPLFDMSNPMSNLIGSLKIKETDFVVSTLHSDCPLLILGKFGEATKI